MITSKEARKDMKDIFNEVKKLSEKQDVFAGFHQNKKDRQVLLWEHDNYVCSKIGEDDYISNLYIEDEHGNLIVVWSYEKGWLK